MSGLYRLLNLEIGHWLRFIAILCAGAVILPLFLLNAAASDYNALANHPRYEDLYAASGCALLFLLLVALLCLYFLITVYSGYWGGKSIYTYLTLPVRRDSLYWSRLIAFAACLLLLLAAQLIGMRLGYSVFESHARNYEDGRLLMHNGLFLAFVRSDFFRLLLPTSFSRALSTGSLFLVLATGCYYGALIERGRKYWGFAAIAAAAYLMFRVLAYRLDEASHTYSTSGLYPTSLMLLALGAFFAWHSLWLIRRGAIA